MGAEATAVKDGDIIGDPASGGSRSSSRSTLKTLAKIRLPGFEPILNTRYSLAANCVTKGAVVISWCS
jgi:hypothetical protein